MPSKMGLGLLITAGAVAVLAALIAAPSLLHPSHPVRTAAEAINIARKALLGPVPANLLSVTQRDGEWIVSDQRGVGTVVIEARTGHVEEASEAFIDLQK